MAKENEKSTLPSLEQTLEALRAVEKKYSDDARIAMTRRVVEENERFVTDRSRLDTYLGQLAKRNLFREIYGLGQAPNGAPLALPGYLMEIMEASARVLCAVSRKNLRERGPGYLVERMPKGWLADEMAEVLYGYFLTHEPDMGFDVLVMGKHSHRGMTFEEFKKSGDLLHCKILEAQSVDTYYGWVREFVKASRMAGLTGDRYQFTWTRGPGGALLTDQELDAQVKATLNYGFEKEPESIHFLEVDPETQPSYQNLVFMCDLMSGGDPGHRPVILDPRDVEIRGEGLYATKKGLERQIKKVISRIVDVDLVAYLKAREKEGATEVCERFRTIYTMKHLFADLSKHLAGFYLIDKSSLTDMSLLGEVSIAPKTELIGPDHLARYRKQPELLKALAIKPLHGMSAKGVFVAPTLAQLEEACAHERMLAQETLWATPLQPCITPEIQDEDVHAGICSESRLVIQAGSPAVAHQPHAFRVVAGLSRSHFQSKDPDRRIKNDPKGRGWYSNVGAIMAVRLELGIERKDDAGVGMAPIYSPL